MVILNIVCHLYVLGSKILAVVIIKIAVCSVVYADWKHSIDVPEVRAVFIIMDVRFTISYFGYKSIGYFKRSNPK